MSSLLVFLHAIPELCEPRMLIRSQRSSRKDPFGCGKTSTDFGGCPLRMTLLALYGSPLILEMVTTQNGVS
jgi:hypothetical protein